LLEASRTAHSEIVKFLTEKGAERYQIKYLAEEGNLHVSAPDSFAMRYVSRSGYLKIINYLNSFG